MFKQIKKKRMWICHGEGGGGGKCVANVVNKHPGSIKCCYFAKQDMANIRLVSIIQLAGQGYHFSPTIRITAPPHIYYGNKRQFY